ncbi:BMP family ABC transporter substrate-binding protein [Nocardiopsis sp. RSe5-2]|uniref:BMP family ABC transporter substrate-binding protein n=1 Tax=Nocardiopsis endophytica TaxID=3018445 RepID=A0ABT4U5C3_9ACTN|nr:BMP family ABC transporter substrate-binding protein [Nocardiopsis endophytica]MDA2812144.1 BMP family ABC transporter substrate-binding protein [Nocardiopsis endophytica]
MRRTIAARGAAAVAAGTLALALSACDDPGGSGGDGEGGGEGGGGSASDLRVGLAYDIGGRGDKSFNDSAYRGLQRVEEELGVAEVNDLEPSKDEPDSAKVDRLRLMADQDFDVVIAVGFAYAEPLREVAPDYPDVHFAIVDEEIDDLDNVTSLVFAEEEASFLAGVAAAHTTEEDHVGFVGGVQTPLIEKFESGFTAGVEHVDDGIEIETQYLSQPPDMGGFQDPAAGKSAARSQYDAGADVIYHAAGASGNGVLEAAEEEEKYFIGVDSDQYESATDAQKPLVVTSAMKRIDTAVFEFVSAVAEGEVESGVQRFDLSDGGVDYADSNEEAMGEIGDELEEAKQQIIDGEIEVSSS